MAQRTDPESYSQLVRWTLADEYDQMIRHLERSLDPEIFRRVLEAMADRDRVLVDCPAPFNLGA